MKTLNCREEQEECVESRTNRHKCHLSWGPCGLSSRQGLVAEEKGVLSPGPASPVQQAAPGTQKFMPSMVGGGGRKFVWPEARPTDLR